jgi:hypothetical protein
MPNLRAHATTCGVAVVALVGGLTAAGAPASATASPIAFGTYTGSVTRPGASDAIALTFQSNGQACLRTVDGLSRGTWAPTGATTFTYKIKEALVGTTGTQTGWIYVDQSAVATGPSFTSEGNSTITDLAGNYQGTSPASVAATYSSADTCC